MLEGDVFTIMLNPLSLQHTKSVAGPCVFVFVFVLFCSFCWGGQFLFYFLKVDPERSKSRSQGSFFISTLPFCII